MWSTVESVHECFNWICIIWMSALSQLMHVIYIIAYQVMDNDGFRIHTRAVTVQNSHRHCLLIITEFFSSYKSVYRIWAQIHFKLRLLLSRWVNFDPKITDPASESWNNYYRLLNYYVHCRHSKFSEVLFYTCSNFRCLSSSRRQDPNSRDTEYVRGSVVIVWANWFIKEGPHRGRRTLPIQGTKLCG